MKFENQHIAEEFLRMDLREEDQWAHDLPDYREHIVHQILYYPAFILPEPANPVVICGFCHALGSGTAWMVASNDFARNIRVILPQQRQLCRGMFRALDLERLDIETMDDWPQAQKYAQKLGFEYEFTKSRAGVNARDLAVYVWPEERERHVGSI